MQNTRSVYLHFKKLKKNINYISIQVCQLVDCSINVVAVILTASTRILNLNMSETAAAAFCRSCFLFRGMVRNEIPRVGFYFFPRNGIPRCFLFRLMVRKEIPRVCFYFWSTERNSELFSLPRKGSERNSENFCSAEQLEFRRK
jgi:hypothetical protein